MRNWTLRIVGIAICILGLLFGGTINRFNFCLGDKVFSALGLPTWTNGTTGAHYPAIIGLIIILVGIAFVNYTLQKRKRIVVWVITVLVLVVLNSALMFI